MMKTSTAPRRIYTRNGITHICFEGKTFTAPKGTEFDLNHPVTCEKVKSDGGRARLEVTQVRTGVAPKVEVWRSVKVPRKARAEKLAA